MNTKAALVFATMLLFGGDTGHESREYRENLAMDLSDGSPMCRAFRQIGFGSDKPVKIFTGVGPTSQWSGARMFRCMYGERLLTSYTTGDLVQS